MKNGRPRQLTREDVAFTLEQISEGIKISYIARYVYGKDTENFKDQLKRWGAL